MFAEIIWLIVTVFVWDMTKSYWMLGLSKVKISRQDKLLAGIIASTMAILVMITYFSGIAIVKFILDNIQIF